MGGGGVGFGGGYWECAGGGGGGRRSVEADPWSTDRSVCGNRGRTHADTRIHAENMLISRLTQDRISQ